MLGAKLRRKKILLLAAKANMIAQFNMRNIKLLQAMDVEVHVATDFVSFGTMDAVTNQQFVAELDKLGVKRHQLSFDRGVGKATHNLQVLCDIRKLLKYEQFYLLHVHSPIGSVLGRIAAIGTGVPVIYTSHGFHFLIGGPLKNWLFFPVEWVLMLATRQLLVINQADYSMAKYLPINQVTYLPSVGGRVAESLAISSDNRQANRQRIRQELGLAEDDYVVLNVGELSVRKNQEAILRAISDMKNDIAIKIIFAGVSSNQDLYEELAERFHMADRVRFLGYRSDLRALHHAADLLVMPSLREGFGMGGFDALVDGLYVIGSRNTGMADYLKNESLGRLIDPHDVQQLTDAIYRCYITKTQPVLMANKDFLMRFDQQHVDGNHGQCLSHLCWYEGGG